MRYKTDHKHAYTLRMNTVPKTKLHGLSPRANYTVPNLLKLLGFGIGSSQGLRICKTKMQRK
jgi:hypothetical protein